MLFSRISQREKYILYISIVVIGFVFIDKVILSPVMKVLDNLDKQTLVQEGELEKSVRIVNNEDSITAEYNKDVQNLKKSSSNEEEIAAMSSEIEELARKTSVLIKSIKPLSTEESSLYTKYKIDIEVETEMPYLMDFIYQLEKSPQLIKVDKISLSPQKKNSPVLKAFLVISKSLIP